MRVPRLRTLILLLCALGGAAVHGGEAVLSPVDLRVEYNDAPLGIDAASPRLSWRSTSESRGARQTAYRIQAAATEAGLATGELLWDSGRVKSDQSLFIPYKGPDPASGDRVTWRVMVWDQDGRASDWSTPAFWEMGLLQPDDWRARWIKPAGPANTSEQRPVAMFRKDFALEGDIQRARLYATARGVYELKLNGQPVGDQVLAPGWTSYHHRIQYQTYDVTDLVNSGGNALGAMLADGWYRGYLGWEGKRNIYGDETALLLQLHITYADGRELVIGTDESWTATTDGPYRMADLYQGEIYDARQILAGWSSPDYDDTEWQPVELFAEKAVALVAPEGPPVRKVEELSPVSITRAPNGEILVDMGQNLVGWPRLRVNGAAGTEVVLRHAEVLDPEGNLYTENLRTADATNRYILAGTGDEIYEPLFTFHGFRYVGISGYPGELTADDITAVVVYSDMARTGHWDSSHPLLNQLYSNIVWGQKGNFLDVPTDCPQRDERLGWTGDAQVFASTAAFNMDVSGFFAKWLRDLELDQQQRDGSVPFVIPDIFDASGSHGMPQHGTAGWADAATVIPWAMYQAYGDEQVLARQFDSMKAWVDYVASRADEDHIWRPGYQFGDWLAPEIQPHPQLPLYQARTETDLIATAYYAHSADLVARAAEVLGRKQEARRYRELFENIRGAFQREFVTPSARMVYATQTAHVLALAFDLLPEADRAAAAAHLAADVRERGNHLTTGFLGTPDLTRVLSEYGQTATAYDLLTQTNYPSWLYPVTFGATTIWERWDAVRTDGTFQNPEMTSFNHYAYGAVGQWMVSGVAGLNAAAPGYREILIHPRPGGGLTRASASLETPYGRAASAWSVEGVQITLDTEIPANTTATVVLPKAAGGDVNENGNALRSAAGIRSMKTVGDDLQLVVGSGRYRFTYSSPELALQAAGFEPFDESTPLGKLLDSEAVKAVFSAHLAEALMQPLQQAATGTLSTMLNTEHYREAAEAVLRALPEVNTTRRAAVLGEHGQH